jgi:hypothetical protein
MRPVSDWVVRLIPGPFQERFLGMNTFYGWPQNHWITGSGDITTPAHFSAAYALWSGAPRHFHREIGRTTPLGDSRERNAIFPSESPMSAGTYIVPGGFRCVR